MKYILIISLLIFTIGTAYAEDCVLTYSTAKDFIAANNLVDAAKAYESILRNDDCKKYSEIMLYSNLFLSRIYTQKAYFFPDKALQYANSGLQIDPNNKDLKYFKARALYAKAQSAIQKKENPNPFLEESTKHLDDIIENQQGLGTNIYWIYNQKGLNQYLEGNYKQAIASYETAIKLLPTENSAIINIANAKMKYAETLIDNYNIAAECNKEEIKIATQYLNSLRDKKDTNLEKSINNRLQSLKNISKKCK